MFDLLDNFATEWLVDSLFGAILSRTIGFPKIKYLRISLCMCMFQNVVSFVCARHWGRIWIR